MRIIHFINSLGTGGAERLAVDLAVEGRERGHDVSIVTMSDQGGVPRAFAHEVGLDVQNLGRSRFDPRVVSDIRSVSIGADVLHAHLFPAFYWAAFAPIPLVFTEHSTSNRRMGQPKWGLLERVVYGRYDAVVAISDGVSRALADHLDAVGGARQVPVVRNGVRSAFFDVRGHSQTERSSGLKLITLGSLTDVKNVALAVEAVAALPEVTLDVVGEGPLRGELASQIDRLDVAGRVRLLGVRADVPSLLPHYDALLSTSRWEGFGLAAAEALASGLPVIGPNVPGLAEVVTHGVDGLLFPSQTPTSVIEAIRTLSEPATYRRLKRDTVLGAERFTMAKCFEAYLNLYRSVAKGSFE